MVRRTNYLNNKDLLIEIHKSKNTFCFYSDPIYSEYDIILDGVDDIFTDEIQEQTKINRIAKIKTQMADEIFAQKGKRIRASNVTVDANLIDPSEFVYRISCDTHIPKVENSKGKLVNIKVNFPPFKHYIIVDGKIIEVGRSQWKGDLKTGEFCVNHGRISEKLGHMYLMLVKRYGQRGNWRGYTYNDEMQGQALLQLSNFGLKFNEARSQNPFAYYTTVITNSFTRVLLSEKKGQSIKETIMTENGLMPTFNQQAAAEIARQKKRDNNQ